MFKHELLYYPGIGTAFYMVGHVPVRRGNKESGKRGLEACADWLRRGAHVFFFPEGTRKISGPDAIGPFKPGAFRLASETGMPILPLTVSGARAVLPMTGFKLGFGRVEIRVHKPIASTNKSAEALMEEARNFMLAQMKTVDEVKYSPPAGTAAKGGVSADERKAR